ncbi:MAG TPA: leucyl/phenylalanyl-tRNA--protein transferase [Candidatus Cybelea sp.]|nr:leucyl/phenylalanyl-tRNA--protein transferase [Candidatus Cybelea sp.]
MSNRAKPSKITAEMLLRAYAIGIFPMAEARNDPELYWIDPESRGIIPLDGFHVSRSLKKTVRRGPFTVTCDTAFERVIEFCAAPGPGRRQTWINQTIFDLCCQLFRMGHAHSVESWRDGNLVGGLYGISLGGAFFGESMFSTETDASKVALVHLVARLKAGNYGLLDTQFVTKHLSGFGALEIPREDYRKRLTSALARRANFQLDLTEDALEDMLDASAAD